MSVAGKKRFNDRVAAAGGDGAVVVVYMCAFDPNVGRQVVW